MVHFCAAAPVHIPAAVDTGPFLVIQVYDQVLTPRSEATLTGIRAFLFQVMELLDDFRAGVLARVGARVQSRLDP